MTGTRNHYDTISTIQNQEQEQQEQQKDRVVSGLGKNYNYNYNSRVCAGARAREASADQEHKLPGEEIMQRIAEAYRENVGPVITRAAATVIEEALKHDMEPSTIIMAIEETGMASRPSPYYLAAILRNWAENGVVLRRQYVSAVSTTNARPWWK